MLTKYILLVINNDHIERNLIRVSTSRALKLKKLHEDILQFEVKFGT
jgi:hypothetical protein